MLNKTCIFTTDIHGTVSAKSNIDQKLNPNGLSRVSTYLKDLEKTHEILLCDNGDNLQGSPLLTYSHKHKLSPNPLALAMNEIEFMYENIGNHDFNYGEEILNQFLEDLGATCITSNVLYKDIPIGSTQIHKFSDGTKLGLIGIVTDYIPHWELPENIRNFKFLNPLETVKNEVVELKENCDFVFVIYHGGIERDLETGIPTENLTGENIGYELTKIDGIDAIISGHQHRSINTKVNNTIILQCAMNASEVMRIDIKDHQLEASLVSMADQDVDQVIENLIQPFEKDVNTWLDTIIGSLEDGDCFITNPFEARIHKHPMVSLLNQVQFSFTMAQISSTALFNQPLGLPQNIRMRDIVNNYVYPNSLVVKKLTGRALKEYLEQNAKYFSMKDGEIIVTPEYDAPKPQHFNYDMLDGIDYTYKISNPIGKRLVEAKVNGQDLVDHDYYTIVMNNYRASGGGNFDIISDAITVTELPLDMTDLIAEYIEKNSPIKIEHKDNIKIIK